MGATQQPQLDNLEARSRRAEYDFRWFRKFKDNTVRIGKTTVGAVNVVYHSDSKTYTLSHDLNGQPVVVLIQGDKKKVKPVLMGLYISKEFQS